LDLLFKKTDNSITWNEGLFLSKVKYLQQKTLQMTTGKASNIQTDKIRKGEKSP